MLIARISDPYLRAAGRLHGGPAASDAPFTAAPRHLAAGPLHVVRDGLGPVGAFPGPLSIA